MEKMTDAKLRKLEGIPGNTQKFIIGSGLFLQVTVNRSGKTIKSWYLRYYDAEGKRQRSKLGDYPELSFSSIRKPFEACATCAASFPFRMLRSFRTTMTCLI